MQVFFARETGKTNFKSDKALYVNNCGYYKRIESDIVINRPNGREDYHLLLVSSGSIVVDGRALRSGEIYFYYPSSPQHYRYVGNENCEYYWLHFSGKKIPEMVEECGLKEGVIDVGSARGDIERLLKMMIKALAERYKNAESFCEGLLSALMSLISPPPTISSPYYKAIKLFGDPIHNETVEEIASSYNMTPNHFIRSFKQYVGMSPNAYRIKKRMEMAEELLISTDMSVEQISLAVGYSDSFYFSRVFKNHVGVSPLQYRKGKRV